MQERVKPQAGSKPIGGNRKAEGRRVTITLDAALVDAAAAKGLDLAEVLEQALRRSVDSGSGGLTSEDREALEWAERLVAKHGQWTDGLETT